MELTIRLAPFAFLISKSLFNFKFIGRLVTAFVRYRRFIFTGFRQLVAELVIDCLAVLEHLQFRRFGYVREFHAVLGNTAVFHTVQLQGRSRSSHRYVKGVGFAANDIPTRPLDANGC